MGRLPFKKGTDPFLNKKSKEKGRKYMKRKLKKQQDNEDVTYTHTHNYFKNYKGITLIALVVTIIVLLILAGTTVFMLVGDNGLLNKVGEAKINIEDAKVDEQVKISTQSALTKDYNKHKKITQATLINELEKDELLEENLKNFKVLETDSRWVLSKEDKKYIIDSNGNVEIIENLQNGYKRLDYIESTGTQYINTGYIPNKNTKIVSIFSRNSYYETYAALYGSQKKATGEDAFGLFVSTKIAARTGHTGGIHTGIDIQENKKYEVSLEYNKLLVNNVKFDGNLEWVNDINYFLYIFCRNAEGSPLTNTYLSAKLYSLKIYDSGTLVRNFIPCKNQQDKVGMYDTVTKTFFENEDTSGDDFTPGPEI